jgi:hypothetical protein
MRRPDRPLERSEAVHRVRRHLTTHDHPRWQMAVMVAITGASGFLFSFALLRMGVTHMGVRYPLAVLLAYGVFLLALWAWIARQRRRFQERPGGTIDFPDVSSLDFPTGSGGSPPAAGGGHFSGGGSSAQVNDIVPVHQPLLEPASGIQDSREGTDAAGGFDVGDGVIVLVLGAVALGGLIVVGYVVYIAPALLAEMLLDAAVVTALYRRLKRTEQQHWLLGAANRTIGPAVILALLLSIAGFAGETMVPGASTLGALLRAL